MKRLSQQTFSKTNELLKDGMCGGPIILSTTNSIQQNHIINDKKLKICGLLEGIVPIDYEETSLQGSAVFVESKEINVFLKCIENREIIPLIGGKVLNDMTKDIDPNNLKLEDLLNKLD